MAAQWNEIPVPTGKEALSRTYPAGYRSDVVDVPVEAGDRGLEYMIRMKAGDTVVYSMAGFYELIPGQVGQPVTSSSGASDE